jgi:serine/threonine protein kinase/WD40 repeat protein
MAAPVSLEEFQRAIVELGIMDAGALARLAAGFPSGVPGLARALVLSGRLTAYQAQALTQGKARGLAVGNYLILDKLGAGGMGMVFRARHRRLGQVVALKILPPSWARDRERVLRFRREIQAAARLDHPHIVSALDADEDRGVHFLTMEYIEGHDLDRLVRQGGALAVEQALDCLIQAARGLEAAHARGIIHRDIKPANLMLDAAGTVRVLDLGLARLVDTTSSFGPAADTALTQSGAYMGTVDFMAPEQAQDARRVDHRADIYSLGCTLHFLLTGRPPFEGANIIQRIMAHREGPAPSLRATRPEVSQPLEAVYLAMMARRLDDRPRSMSEVIARLESCRSSADEAQHARSGLKRFSTTAIASTAPTPQETNFELSIFARSDDEQPVPLDPSRPCDDRVVDDHPPLPLAIAPRETTASPRQHQRSASGSSGSHRRRRVALAALGGAAALGILLAAFTVNRPRPDSASVLQERTEQPAKRPAEAAPDSIALQSVDEVSGPGTIATPGTPGTPAPVSKTFLAPEKASARPVMTVRVAPNTPAKVPPRPAPVPTYDVAERFRGHKTPVKAIAITQDGRLALSAAGKAARLWDVRTGREVRPQLGHPSDVLDVAITPDGRWALTATWGLTNHDGGLRLWNLDGPHPVAKYLRSGHVGPVRAVALFPHGHTLRGLSGGEDGRAILWDLSVSRQIWTMGPQKGSIHSRAIAFSPSGRMAITAGQDRLVHLWNLATGQESARWQGHRDSINALAISADGRRALTGSADQTVILWDTSTGSPIRRFKMPDGDRQPSVGFLPDGSIVAAGGQIGRLVLWDAHSGTILRQADGPLIKHAALAVLPDGHRVLTADDDAVVRIWTPRPR